MIPPFLLKDFAGVLAKPLQHIILIKINLLLTTPIYPEQWKLTRVVPVLKSKGNTEVDGYRPIAVQSSVVKVFEIIFQDKIYTQIRGHLTDVQYGFLPSRSTDNNLLYFMSYTCLALDSRIQVDAADFDFQKAFDTVDNYVLLTKLAAIECTPNLLQ